MKKLIQIFSMMMVLVIVGGMFSACEGPEGPEGPAGKDGVAAIPTCDNCHNVDTDLKARMLQYAASTHALGGNFERNGTSCAPCHTHEGFMEVLASGEVTTAPSNPTPPGCRTCHNIHTTYKVEDYALTTTDPVVLDVSGKTYDKGKSNLCANCHQSRPISPMPLFNDDMVNITSIRFGPHHGPQSNFLMAAGLVEIPGKEVYPTGNPHGGTGNGCVDCHMAAPYGAQAGGHTMAVAYDYHGTTELSTAGCITCHTDEDALVVKFEDYQTEMQGLMDQIAAKLLEKNLIDDENYAKTGEISGKLASAVLNYRSVLEDQSLGVHNPKYVRALLKNTLESLQ